MTAAAAAGPMPQWPTLEGYAEGIIATSPLVLQCRECGLTLTQPQARRPAAFIILSGWHFHICEGATGVRRCRDCLAETVAHCPSGRCKR